MDHCDVKERRRNPRETASIFSLLTFTYSTSLFKRAYKKDLEEADLYAVVNNCSSSKLGSELEKRWNDEKIKDKPKSLYRILWDTIWVRYTLMASSELTFRIARSLVEPNAYANLVGYFSENQTKFTKTDAYHNAGILIFFTLAGMIFYNNLFIYGIGLGIEIRTSFSAFLYRKALKLSPKALSEVSFGNIVTLITKDVQTFENSIWILSDICIGFLHACVVCYLLYARIGPTIFIGISIYIIVLPIQVYLGKLLKKLRMTANQKTDERLQKTQEALSMIRIIKMYNWQDYFIERINIYRRSEINKMVAGIYLNLLQMLLGLLVSRLGFYLLIMAYIWMDHTPDSSIIFFIMSMYTDIRWFFGTTLPNGIGQTAFFMSSLERLNKVLKTEELPTPTTNISENTEKVHKPKVNLENVTISIGQTEILKNTSFRLNSGLSLVTGQVGTGKSSLLKVILQEFPVTNGKVAVEGDISYASQDPWLFASSIKQNILFGQEYNPKRYQEVIRVCALDYDLSLFENGDETILTDRGLNLSKGQQSRVNLARAIYKESDIYLLDDCLTSLDNHVSDFIFNECIRKFLREKMCLLVSQTGRHIKQADYVYIMKEGNIQKITEPSEVLYTNPLIHEENMKNIKKNKEIDEEPKETHKLLETEQNIERKQVFKEVLKKGSVPLEKYKKYMAFGGGIFMILSYLIFSGFYQFTESYSEKLLTKWVDHQQTYLNIRGNLSNLTDTFAIFNNDSIEYLNLTERLQTADVQQKTTFKWYYVTLFTATGLNLIKIYLMFDFCRRASIKIHTYIIKRMINAVMCFFDKHYIGTILNRLSQDLTNMDEQFSFILNECFRIVYAIVGSLVLIISVNYYFIIYVGLAILTLGYMGRIYLPFGRSMKRLEVSTRSPILGHLNSTFEGITTIRAYKAQNILLKEFDRHHDVYTSSHYTLAVGQTAYGFFGGCVCEFLVTSVIFTFIFLDTGTSAGNVGLALGQAFGICYTIQWAIRQYAELESMMTSVERVLEYTDINTENQTGTLVDSWPANGAVKYDQVKLSYNKSDVILNNMSFQIDPKQKIGVIGRTGAGKSSIVSTIFRLYDVEGRISIDGVDIKTIPLKILRRNLAIIPQDPVLFTGTIRSNLDPFGEYKDEELWNALEKANLKNFVSDLDVLVTGNSSNFSLGQKQMICVARAILRKVKIVILDEATANMDQDTEIVISNVIKNNFADCTVLTIAHRLQSILECDKIMVLDRGELVAFDSPKELLKNQNGYFYKIMQNS